MERDAMLVVRFPSEIKNALRRAADAETRSMSTIALIALVEWLTGRGYLPKTRPGKRRSWRK